MTTELKTERQALRISQAEAARRMGVATNTWARWERDERDMGEPYLRLWARIAQELAQEGIAAAQAVRDSIEEPGHEH